MYIINQRKSLQDQKPLKTGCKFPRRYRDKVSFSFVIFRINGILLQTIFDYYILLKTQNKYLSDCTHFGIKFCPLVAE